jgi:signal transduction histidine kinase
MLQYLGYSKQAAQFLLSLITDILDIAKLEKGTLVLQEKAFDLHEAVQAVYRMVKPQMEASSCIIFLRTNCRNTPGMWRTRCA